jgi:hypothetical protein
VPDPTLCCTSFGRKRFYLFSRREPQADDGAEGRDVFNERPDADEVSAITTYILNNTVCNTVSITTSITTTKHLTTLSVILLALLSAVLVLQYYR